MLNGTFVRPAPLPTKRPADTFPLVEMLPFENRTFPTFPDDAMMLETFAYAPMTLPRMLTGCTVYWMFPGTFVRPAPLPTNRPADTFPFAEMLPFENRTFPMFPTDAMMLETFAYAPMTLPDMLIT